MKKKPLVSVLIPAYNHSGYVGEAIESVLRQSYENLELLVEDDFSTDGTREVLEKLKGVDKRLKIIFAKENRGTVRTLNHLLKEARGEYIAVLGSDDVWREDKLEKQMEVFAEHPKIGAVFSLAEIIDEKGEKYEDDARFREGIFRAGNMSAGERLRLFFEGGNHLCHPSSVIPRKVMDKIGVYNPLYRQLHDFEYWVRLLNKYEIFVVDEKLVKYRRFKGAGANQSGDAREGMVRNINEQGVLMKKMFREMSDENFREGFADLFVNKKRPELECEKFLILLNYKVLGVNNRQVATEFLFEAENSDKIVENLAKYYQFSLGDIYGVSGEMFELYPENFSETINSLRAENERLETEKNELTETLAGILKSKAWRIAEKVRKVKGKIIK